MVVREIIVDEWRDNEGVLNRRESKQLLVRCQDCKHWVPQFNGCSRNPCTEPWYATDFCNYGERN